MWCAKDVIENKGVKERNEVALCKCWGGVKAPGRWNIEGERTELLDGADCSIQLNVESIEP